MDLVVVDPPDAAHVGQLGDGLDLRGVDRDRSRDEGPVDATELTTAHAPDLTEQRLQAVAGPAEVLPLLVLVIRPPNCL